MKGYLTCVMGILALGMAIFVSGCSEDSGWGASYGGMQLQQDGTPSVPAGTAPPGSGAVGYVPPQNAF
jgi:hypothetical protein